MNNSFDPRETGSYLPNTEPKYGGIGPGIPSTVDPTSYGRKQHEKAMEEKAAQMRQEMLDWVTLPEVSKPTLGVTEAMNLVEKLITAGGGEKRVLFGEVTRRMLKVKTRIKMEANLYPFLDEGLDNPRFHKSISQLLLEAKAIDAVRWVPLEDGCVLIVEYRPKVSDGE